MSILRKLLQAALDRTEPAHDPGKALMRHPGTPPARYNPQALMRPEPMVRPPYPEYADAYPLPPSQAVVPVQPMPPEPLHYPHPGYPPQIAPYYPPPPPMPYYPPPPPVQYYAPPPPPPPAPPKRRKITIRHTHRKGLLESLVTWGDKE